MQKTHIEAICANCGVCVVIRRTSYNRNLRRNKVYLCHTCKVSHNKIELTCLECGCSFELSNGQIFKHKKPRLFCSSQCSIKYQQRQYDELRKSGKKCSMCGQTKQLDEFVMAAAGKKNPRTNKIYQYCKACKRLYRLRHTNLQKIKAVMYLGGKCERCGCRASIDLHPAAFDFHHRDPTNKEFNISKSGKKWEVVLSELKKCSLLCANCHRIIHVNHELWPG